MIKIELTRDILFKIRAVFRSEYSDTRNRLIYNRYELWFDNENNYITVEEYLKSKGYRIRVFTREHHQQYTSSMSYLLFFDIMDYLRFI